MSQRTEQLRLLRELADGAAALMTEAAATPAAEELAAGERLRRRWGADLVAAAFTQRELRERAGTKLAHSDRMWLTREGLEQASGEATATHRADRLSDCLRPDAVVVDLGCGIGGDTRAMASRLPGGRVLALDRDEVHAWCCRANVSAAADPTGHSVPIPVATGDVRDLRLDHLDQAAGATALLLDPARRSGGRRTSALNTQPRLEWATELTRYVPAVVVKAGPGLPHEAVPPGWSVEYVAVGTGLKEAVLWSPATRTARVAQPRPGGGPGTARWATVLTGPAHRPAEAARTHTLWADPATAPAPVRAPGAWLLDPSPAVTRAGAVADLAAATGCWQIDPAIAFLCGGHPVATPFARTYAVAESLPFHERHLREVLHGLDVGAVDIRRRGLAGDVERLRGRLRLTGERRALLAMTRWDGRPWAIVAFPAPQVPAS